MDHDPPPTFVGTGGGTRPTQGNVELCLAHLRGEVAKAGGRLCHDPGVKGPNKTKDAK